MDNTDRQLLNIMQNEFPVCEEPFLEIGKKLNISEKEVLKKVQKLKSDGIIRRMGGVFNSKCIGYKSCLLAVKVPPLDIETAARYINRFPGVTHNYQRSHAYNLWFTLSASSPERFNKIVEMIKINTGISDILELPAINVFQHEVKFNL
jgi:DNA-binding Lrp family transcriptional regulator